MQSFELSRIYEEFIFDFPLESLLQGRQVGGVHVHHHPSLTVVGTGVVREVLNVRSRDKAKRNDESGRIIFAAPSRFGLRTTAAVLSTTTTPLDLRPIQFSFQQTGRS
mmetsp:Transcript_4780/g.9435  ORF Transcript_4780/g.9435 Transcript_4780/m.9435 type:complete len:108 (-) Transcript_4780:117-440(-)